MTNAIAEPETVLQTNIFDKWPGTLGELSRVTGIPLSTLSRTRSGDRTIGPDFRLAIVRTFGGKDSDYFFRVPVTKGDEVL